jgi:Golgi SNAP receptor complex protein 2
MCGGQAIDPSVCTGQIAASLASLSRTVDDYSALSKKELIPEKQQKAFDRVKNFRDELSDYRTQFDRLRKEREDAVRQHTRPLALSY